MESIYELAGVINPIAVPRESIRIAMRPTPGMSNGSRMALERIAEHRFALDAFGSPGERRRQLLERLLPPPGNEPPAHRDKLSGATFDGPHDLDGIRWRDVVMGL